MWSLNVQSYWVAGLIRTASGGLDLVNLSAPVSSAGTPISMAISDIKSQVLSLSAENPGAAIVPVWCFHTPTPLVGGVRSLMSPVLPQDLARDIEVLAMRDPVDVRTPVAGVRRGSLGNTIVDFNHERITVLGNAEAITEYIRLIGSRFLFSPDETPMQIVARIRHMIDRGPSVITGSTAMISGFGAIFAFNFGFLFNQLHIAHSGSVAAMLATIFCGLAGVAFLTEEVFSAHFVALSKPWTLRYRYVSMVLLIVFLMLSLLLLLLPEVGNLARWSLWSWGILISSTCAATSCGQLLHYGLTRRAIVSLHLLILFAISLFSLAS